MAKNTVSVRRWSQSIFSPTQYFSIFRRKRQAFEWMSLQVPNLAKALCFLRKELLERLYGSTWHLGKEIQEWKHLLEDLKERLKSYIRLFRLFISSSVHTASGRYELAAPCI